MTRSPSFSRSSSSTTTTISPRPIAATASSILANGMSVRSLPREQTLDVLGRHVDLEVHGVAGLLGTEVGDLGGVRDHRHREPVVEDIDDREADAVDGDRALLDDVAQQVAVADADLEIRRGLHDLTDAVDVTLDHVTAEAIGQPDRAL